MFDIGVLMLDGTCEMNSDCIGAFSTSVSVTFSTMLSSSVRRIGVRHETGRLIPDSVNAAIELSGSVSGTVVLSLSDTTAIEIVNALLCLELSEINEDVLDGISEILNIIVGGAKASLPGASETPIHLGIPRIFPNDNSSTPSAKEWIRLAFNSQWGFLDLWMALEN